VPSWSTLLFVCVCVCVCVFVWGGVGVGLRGRAGEGAEKVSLHWAGLLLF